MSKLCNPIAAPAHYNGNVNFESGTGNCVSLLHNQVENIPEQQNISHYRAIELAIEWVNV